MTNHSTPATHNLEIALALGKQGVVIIPCRPNKVPYVKNWPAAGAADEPTIRDWWRRFPDAIPGTPCGANGLLVVDCDRKNGVDGLSDWEGQCTRNGFDLGRCFAVETPSGGRHYYFRQPAGPLLGNTVAKIAAGVDTRGDGGQVIAPGTMLPDGRSYRAIAGALTATSVIPDGLRIFLTEPERQQPASTPKNEIHAVHEAERAERAYGLAALGDEARKVREAPQGIRNSTLNVAAFAVGTLIPHYGLSREEAEAALTAAALAAGLEREEIAKTLKSGLDSGMKNPRSPLPVLEIPEGLRDFAAEGRLRFNRLRAKQ